MRLKFVENMSSMWNGDYVSVSVKTRKILKNQKAWLSKKNLQPFHVHLMFQRTFNSIVDGNKISVMSQRDRTVRILDVLHQVDVVVVVVKKFRTFGHPSDATEWGSRWALNLTSIDMSLLVCLFKKTDVSVMCCSNLTLRFKWLKDLLT